MTSQHQMIGLPRTISQQRMMSQHAMMSQHRSRVMP
jgi:hypothetical protein